MKRSFWSLFVSVVLGLAVSSGAANAEAVWFNIKGDSSKPNLDTVEVDVDSAIQQGDSRLVNLRVNRAGSRTAYDHLPYRSYHSSVLINCDTLTGNHSVLTLFSGPLWKGDQRVLRYIGADGPDLAFADMTPNPNARIIRAACSIASIKTR